MKISLKVNEKTLTATMIDSRTTDDFVKQLPLKLTLEDYANTEKISYLPIKLSTEGAPKGSKASIGDITYYAPWGNLAIFYKDLPYAAGLVMLGTIDNEKGFFNLDGSVDAVIELLAE